MLPAQVALVEDDSEFSEYLSQYLDERGIEVRVFPDSSDLITSATAFDFDFYVVDLMLPSVDGVELIKLLRRRTDAGVLVVSGRLGTDVFRDVMQAGADMFLSKPVEFEQVALAIQAVQRRAGRSQAPAVWRLDRIHSELIAPDGARIALSEADLVVMNCFFNAGGEVVPRETLRAALGKPQPDGPDDGLNAIIYRLRRRIERATPSLVPLQSRSRVGYFFKATLVES